MANNITNSNEPLPSKKTSVGRYWKAILDKIQDSITVYDPAGNVVYANELASKDLRYSSVEHLMGQHFSDIIGRFLIQDEHGRPVDPDNLPTMRAMRNLAIAEQTVQFTMLKDTKSFWLVAKAFPILDRRKHLKYVVSTYYEVTTFKEAEAQLRESNRRMLMILDELIDLQHD